MTNVFYVSAADTLLDINARGLPNFMDGGRRHRGQQNEDTEPLTRADAVDQPYYLESEYVESTDDVHGDVQGYTRLVALPARRAVPLKEPTVANQTPYTFTRYPARATVNIVGPLFVLAYFLFVIYEYLEKPAVNDVAPIRPINAKPVFFFWVILSIFILDWAKSAIAGFEAAALMNPRLAPSKAIHLMWHLDRQWGSFSGWYRAAIYTFKYWFGKEGRATNAHWDGPGFLWWYLAVSSLLFFIAVPLLGLTMDPDDALHLTGREVIVLGPNQTTFDARTNPQVADLARNTWRDGSPTTPLTPTVFYAEERKDYVSDMFYNDVIQTIYHADLANKSTADRNITFFSGPSVAERAHGRSWGLLTSVSCSAVNIYNGLKLINVTSKKVWATNYYDSDTWAGESSYTLAGLYPSMVFNDTAFGVNFEYYLAMSDSYLEIPGEPAPEYNNASKLPIEGSLEIAMWQSLIPGYVQDEEYVNMTSNPLVEKSNGFLGYGVRCEVRSDVGFANLDAAKRTYSNFDQQPSELPPEALGAALTSAPIYQYPGVLSIQWVVLTALTKFIPGFGLPPSCLPKYASIGYDEMCSVFYSANLATGGVPYLANFSQGTVSGSLLRQPAIGPERMCLAMYKIFGSTASAMMAQGDGNWTMSDLKGVTQANNLVAGPIPWQPVLAILIAWALITVLPQFWTFTAKRWSATLDPFELFRFGGEWRDAIQAFESNEAWENKILRRLPGMIGDMERQKKMGFVGLSYEPADPGKEYVNDRSKA